MSRPLAIRPFKGFSPYFKVFVYRTHKAMVRAISDLDGLSADEAEKSAACAYVRKRGRILDKDPDLVACLYFNKENLEQNTICHEALHAAMCWDRTVNGFCGDYGSVPTDHDERLAELHGVIAEALLKAL
jgi:hypothetical protein